MKNRVKAWLWYVLMYGGIMTLATGEGRFSFMGGSVCLAFGLYMASHRLYPEVSDA